MSEISYATLRQANIARQQEWDVGNQLTLAYRGNELAGEVGEACNVIKKLERERLGIAGSRDTIEHLAEELADVVICADLIAMQAGVDLDAAVEAKFNATSEKVGLATRYSRAEARQAPGEWPDKCHPSHKTRVSVDASSYDEICDVCGATDNAIGGWGELRKPCPGATPAPLPAGTVTEEMVERAIAAWEATFLPAFPTPVSTTSRLAMRAALEAAIAARSAEPVAVNATGVAEIDALAQEIRRVDGDNSLGAGALAEALMPFIRVAREALASITETGGAK